MSKNVEKLRKFLKDNDMNLIQVQLLLDEEGFVTVTQAQYDNLQVIDPDGACP